jgi:hypothetical protein
MLAMPLLFTVTGPVANSAPISPMSKSLPTEMLTPESVILPDPASLPISNRCTAIVPVPVALASPPLPMMAIVVALGTVVGFQLLVVNQFPAEAPTPGFVQEVCDRAAGAPIKIINHDDNDNAKRQSEANVLLACTFAACTATQTRLLESTACEENSSCSRCENSPCRG